MPSGPESSKMSSKSWFVYSKFHWGIFLDVPWGCPRWNLEDFWWTYFLYLRSFDTSKNFQKDLICVFIFVFKRLSKYENFKVGLHFRSEGSASYSEHPGIPANSAWARRTVSLKTPCDLWWFSGFLERKRLIFLAKFQWLLEYMTIELAHPWRIVYNFSYE